MKKIIPLFLAALLTLSLTAPAQDLALGDPAPELRVSKWIKAGPVEELDPAKTYVVEFWATWCGPCRSAIPHVTELAKKFTDVVFIGVNVWEDGKEEKVVQFVEKMGDKMDYNVAIDAADQHMAKQWMEAAGQNGIPSAFVVHQGQVVWVGHPMRELEQVLEDIEAGTYDMETVRKRAEAEARVEAFYMKAAEGATDEELAEEGRALEALDRELGGLSPDQEAFDAAATIQMARFGNAMEAYQAALLEELPEEEIAPLEKAARAAAPEDLDFDKIQEGLLSSLEDQRGMMLLNEYFTAVGEDGDAGQAAELGAKIEALDLDPEVLNNVAWLILTGEDIQHRDLPLATRLAKKALDASEDHSGHEHHGAGDNAHILDTYARALFDSGNLAEALEYQKKAAALRPDDEEITSALERYQAAADEAAEPAEEPEAAEEESKDVE